MNRIRILLWMVMGCSALAAGAHAQEPVPVVLAVDVSRSLTAAELVRVGETLSTFVGQLPPETPAGLLVFADQPRWIAQPAAPASALSAELRALRPEGRFTLLYDALFAASSALAQGGVVVLVTDGRDENSATTLDDIARIYAERGIRIVALGAGGDPVERDLRRLALLSSGAYAGVARESSTPALATAAAGAIAGIADQRAAAAARVSAPAVPSGTPDSSPSAAPATPATDLEPDPKGPVAPAAAGSGDSGTNAAGRSVPWWWWLVVAAFALAALAGVALLLRRRAPRAAVCPRCGTELPAGASGECASCAEAALIERLRSRPVSGPGHAVDAFLDTGEVPHLSLEQRLDRTAVMIDQPALVVKEAGEPPRSFALSEDQAFAVGREPSRNTLAIPSVSLSAEHFRVVPEPDGYYLLDLQSTNGTFLNGARVRAAKLAQGDRVRAGQVEFDFTVHQQFAPLRSQTPPKRSGASGAAS